MPKINKDEQEQTGNIASNVARYTIKALDSAKEKIPCSVYVVGKACIISFSSSDYTMPIAELIYSMPREGKEVCYFECNGNIKPLLAVINLIDKILNQKNAKN